MESGVDALSVALKGEREVLAQKYMTSRPGSEAAFQKACAVQPGGTTRSNLHQAPFPVTIASACRSVLTDIDGFEYVDLLNDYAVGMAGHSNPTIFEALRDQLDRGTNFGGRSIKETELAELIVARFASIDSVRFTNSGTESNLYALLLARAVTGRSKILMFEGGYLGGVLSQATKDRRLLAPFEFVTVPYNDVDAFDEAMGKHSGKIAVVATELMLNSGGCIPADPEFIRHVADVCRCNDSLFLVDEVMTSRLEFSGLQSRYGVSPDITTLGKMIGGGLSAGAIGGSRDIMQQFDVRTEQPLLHNGSFNNNILSMVAGVAALRHVLTKAAIDQTSELGDNLRNMLNESLEARDIGLVWSGIGSAMALHLGRQAPQRFAPQALEKPIRELLHMFMLLNGFWIAPRGMLSLSVENTNEHAQALADTFGGFLDTYRNLLTGLPSSVEVAA